MPGQRDVSSLFRKIQDRTDPCLLSHRDIPPVYDTGGDLPPGINGGVARLVECKFDVFKQGVNEGELFFLAAGIVVSPINHNEEHIAGRRTQIGPEPLCDTPNAQGRRRTLEDHLHWVQDELKKLLGEGSSVEILGDWQGLIQVAQGLKEAQPHFRFRTWRGKPTETFPNPRVQHVWNGFCDWTDEAEPWDSVNDQSNSIVNPSTDRSPKESKESPKDGSAGTFSEFSDLSSLAGKASIDENAQAELIRLALGAGVSQGEINGADSWQEVVQLMSERAQNPTSGSVTKDSGDKKESESPKLTDPGMGDVFYYRPMDLKTKKAGKRTECEVIKIDHEMKTVSLRNLDNPKLQYHGVKWEFLEV